MPRGYHFRSLNDTLLVLKPECHPCRRRPRWSPSPSSRSSSARMTAYRRSPLAYGRCRAGTGSTSSSWTAAPTPKRRGRLAGWPRARASACCARRSPVSGSPAITAWLRRAPNGSPSWMTMFAPPSAGPRRCWTGPPPYRRSPPMPVDRFGRSPAGKFRTGGRSSCDPVYPSSTVSDPGASGTIICQRISRCSARISSSARHWRLSRAARPQRQVTRLR
jgi:hypothetical protein